MSHSDLEARVISLVSETLSIDKDSVSLSSRFQEDLGADSLDITELLMEIEEEFSVSIPDEESEKLKTVGDALKYLKEKGV
jgi:acyl carrier protein